jgi:hypothetical protein
VRACVRTIGMAKVELPDGASMPMGTLNGDSQLWHQATQLEMDSLDMREV